MTETFTRQQLQREVARRMGDYMSMLQMLTSPDKEQELMGELWAKDETWQILCDEWERRMSDLGMNDGEIAVTIDTMRDTVHNRAFHHIRNLREQLNHHAHRSDVHD